MKNLLIFGFLCTYQSFANSINAANRSNDINTKNTIEDNIDSYENVEIKCIFESGKGNMYTIKTRSGHQAVYTCGNNQFCFTEKYEESNTEYGYCDTKERTKGNNSKPDNLVSVIQNKGTDTKSTSNKKGYSISLRDSSALTKQNVFKPNGKYESLVKFYKVGSYCSINHNNITSMNGEYEFAQSCYSPNSIEDNTFIDCINNKVIANKCNKGEICLNSGKSVTCIPGEVSQKTLKALYSKVSDENQHNFKMFSKRDGNSESCSNEGTFKCISPSGGGKAYSRCTNGRYETLLCEGSTVCFQKNDSVSCEDPIKVEPGTRQAGQCTVEGSLVCQSPDGQGKLFSQCSNGAYVGFTCAEGTVCFQKGNEVTCDHPENPRNLQACSENDTLTCSQPDGQGKLFSQCSNGYSIGFTCAEGTVCYQKGKEVTCERPSNPQNLEVCSINDKLTCSQPDGQGQAFSQCSNGFAIKFNCGAGTFCFQKGNEVTCDIAGGGSPQASQRNLEQNSISSKHKKNTKQSGTSNGTCTTDNSARCSNPGVSAIYYVCNAGVEEALSCNDGQVCSENETEVYCESLTNSTALQSPPQAVDAANASAVQQNPAEPALVTNTGLINQAILSSQKYTATSTNIGYSGVMPTINSYSAAVLPTTTSNLPTKITPTTTTSNLPTTTSNLPTTTSNIPTTTSNLPTKITPTTTTSNLPTTRRSYYIGVLVSSTTPTPTVIPTTGTSNPTVIPTTGTSNPTVIPTTGTSNPTVIPTTGTSNPTVIPTTGTSNPTVIPTTATSMPKIPYIAYSSNCVIISGSCNIPQPTVTSTVTIYTKTVTTGKTQYITVSTTVCTASTNVLAANSSTDTSTDTVTLTSTSTDTATLTSTSTDTITSTSTSTNTITSTSTSTDTITSTSTSTNTITSTSTSTDTITSTSMSTDTATLTGTSTDTSVSTITDTTTSTAPGLRKGLTNNNSGRKNHVNMVLETITKSVGTDVTVYEKMVTLTEKETSTQTSTMKMANVMVIDNKIGKNGGMKDVGNFVNKDPGIFLPTVQTATRLVLNPLLYP
ncbi:hypothetical protein BB558_000088 [Smittium angustum]|uniref:Carbohydrate-binding module family 19 domain-containing protein n=1 Tax=Smittium angustum TaxID=133377 RepID=A0A2U1JF58_SMIAN|nr:hypothetical protein BB558_000088 [Smittium angustum]